jgi:hypothetical protein
MVLAIGATTYDKQFSLLQPQLNWEPILVFPFLNLCSYIYCLPGPRLVDVNSKNAERSTL